MNIRIKIPNFEWLLLICVVAISSSIFFHNLGKNYITHWDEVVTVNVVKNLATDCCTPKLHLQDYNTDYRNWTDNFVWLHKPIMPFYVNAAFFNILGKNLWAFRLPNVLFAELIIILLFYIGKRFFGSWVAIITTS